VTDCFSYGDIAVPPAPDATVSLDEVYAWIDAFATVPQGLRGDFFQCIRPLWNDIQFGEDGDNLVLNWHGGNSLVIQTLPFDYGSLESYPGLDFPPPG